MIRAIKTTLGMAVIGAAVILASGLSANAQSVYYPQQDDGYYDRDRHAQKRYEKARKRAIKRHRQNGKLQQQYRRDNGYGGGYNNDGSYNNGGYNNDGYNNDGYNNGGYNNNGGYYENQNREALRQAISQGYQAGFREGQRARQYGNRGGYSNGGYNNQRYGNQGYGGGQYQQYYQQGFQRGYQDGYNRTSRYNSGNSQNIITSILGSILNR